jgi:hypothetical protein
MAKKLTRIDRMRRIVDGGGYARVEGHLVDLVTANAFVNVYDALNDENKALLDSFDLLKAVRVVWKLVK